MANNSSKQTLARILSTLQDLLILQLAQVSVTQPEIRKLLGVDIVRVNRVAKLLKKRGKGPERMERT